MQVQYSSMDELKETFIYLFLLVHMSQLKIPFELTFQSQISSCGLRSIPPLVAADAPGDNFRSGVRFLF